MYELSAKNDRLKEDGRYELISGHRRKKACELAGLETLKCEVKELTRDEAIIVMVESNLQRSVILPSEKAFAYKMRLEAMKRQGQRSDLTSSPVATKLQSGRSDEELGELVGESKEQIRRFIRLKTFKFEDINYAVASREDKEAMFLEYSELLNSLDSGATTKITINNRRLNKADFEQTRAFFYVMGIAEETRKNINAVKGTIKTIDKAAVASERMKAAYAKTKDKAEQGYYAEESSATEYAADKISHTADRVKDEGIHQFNKQGQKSVQTTKENIVKAKDKVADFKQKRAVKSAEKKQAQATAERNGSQPRHGTVSRSPAPDAPANAGANGKSQLIKTRQQGQKTIKTTARNAQKTVKSTAKGTVKTAEKGVKTAQATSKAAIKTTEQTAKATKAAAKASAKAAQRAAQAAKATAKATAHAVKVAVKATLAAIKAIIAGTKALIAAIMAGGWIAVAVILIICLIGLLVGSVFGMADS